MNFCSVYRKHKMERNYKFCPNYWIVFLVCLLTTLCSSESDSQFLAEMFINECLKETWYIFPGDNPSPKYPSVLISMCHALPVNQSIINYQDIIEIKPVPRFSSHSFRLNFVFIKTKLQVEIWQAIYERLMMTSIQHERFVKMSEIHENDYPKYTSTEFKLEFLRSRWNIDVISLYESNAAYAHLTFGKAEGRLPYSMEKDMNRAKNISDLIELKLLYRVISGRGHKCKHENMLAKLKSLTLDFNAYDRIFCDAFEHYNLSFEGYWNEADMVFLRARLLRDEILSSFPPEASKAVYYASPMITFVVLKRDPLTWQFIFRPFPISLWKLIVVTLLILKGAHQLGNLKCVKVKKTDGIMSAYFRTYFIQRYLNVIEFIGGLYRMVIVSAYGGMILLGILYPTYTWTPDLFSELNGTTKYKVCTSFDAPIKHTHLIENLKLNGIPEKNWKVRSKWFPAQYFAPHVLASREIRIEADQQNKTTKENTPYFNAPLMYDDKMNLWMKGREFLNFTFSIFDKLKPAHDKVLSEIRYASVAAGATRLHFVLDAIKWGFTCGVWIRYYYLEANYYKNVAPLIVSRMKMNERGSMKEDVSIYKAEEIKRPLTLEDLYASFIVNGIGLLSACLVALVEIVRKGCCNVILETY